MEDKEKTKEQLVKELAGLRQQITESKILDSKHKPKKEVFKHEENILIKLLNTMEDGVLIVSQNHDIQFINKVLEKDFGSYKGKKCYEYFHERKEVCPWCKNQDVFAGKTVRWEWYFSKKKRTYDLIDTPFRNPDGSIFKLEILRDITLRKQTEEALQKSEERYRTMFERMNDGVAIYKAVDSGNDFIFVDFNTASENINKIKREELIGKSLLQTFPGVEEFGLFEVFQRVWSTGNPESCPIAQYKDERISGWRENFVYKLPSGEIVAIYSDKTGRKQAEEDLIKIKTALDGASDAIGMTDINMKIIYQNQAFLDMFGYTADEIEKKGIAETYRDVDFAKKGVQTIKDGRTWKGEVQIRSKDGKDPICFLSASPIFDDRGNIIGFFSRHTDITERKKMEERVLQSEKLKSLGELAGGVAHDFNNVLAAILGRAQLLEMEMETPPGKEERRKSVIELRGGLEIIEKAAKDGAETVRRIQEFARKRDVDKCFATVDLNEIVDNALEFTKMKWKNNAESKGIKINIKKELSPLPTTSGSAAELREVFTNLINNAADAMPQGGTIKIKTFKEDSLIVVKVEDTGVGIAADRSDKVFDPFFTNKGVKSSGLGLSVSYGIISRHQGTIIVDSIEGQGTVFTIKLPISAKITKEEKVKPVPKEQRKARILVIEDEEEVRNLLFHILTKGGHEVEIVLDGNQGIEMFEKKEFDLVFTDLGMPGMSVWQVAERIKSINRKTPVILITGWDINLNELNTGENGVDLIILKPFEVEQILSNVQEGMVLRDKFKTV